MLKEKSIPRYWHYVFLFCAIFMIYVVFTMFHATAYVKTFMSIFSIIGVIAISYYLVCEKEKPIGKIITMILFLGFVMRIGYMLYTPCTLRGHDFGMITKDGGGHAAYILYLLEGTLPPSNIMQFYHPPLYHALSAAVIKILELFLHSKSPEAMLNGAKIISCFASCGALLLIHSMVSELKLSNFMHITVLAGVSFFPQFYLLSGMVNNDSLAVFFMMLILLFTIKWYQNPCLKNIIPIAVGFGLGMMTKMSVGIFALWTGVIFIVKGIGFLKKKKLGTLFKQYGLFSCIAFPLGLWYPVRNFLLFHQPFNYVLRVNDTLFQSNHYSFFKRFLTFPIAHIASPVYANVYTDYNIWLYTLKSALYGEFKFFVSSLLPQMLTWVYFALCVMMIVAIVRLCIYKNDRAPITKYLLLLGAILWVSFLAFNIKYPVGCSMDFRYIVPVFLLGMLFMGVAPSFQTEKAEKIWRVIFSIIISAFSLLSILMYCMVR